MLAEDTLEREFTLTKLIEMALTDQMQVKLVRTTKFHITRRTIVGAALVTRKSCSTDAGCVHG